jgi:phosphoribosylformylglycinamidine cyclo-ligase
VDNIPRVLPANLDVVIRKGSWEMLPIFQLIAAKGGVDEAELYQVFNMGIGMVALVAAEQADAVLKCPRVHPPHAARRTGKAQGWLIGEVVKGKVRRGWNNKAMINRRWVLCNL